MLYALVQKSLDQTIDRRSMEEASVFVPSIARADCARLHRDLFGFVVSGLSRDDAIAFQVALEHYRFPTEIIPVDQIPNLPPPVFRRGIRFHETEFDAIDGLGRGDRFSWNDVQFAGGGFVQKLKLTTERQLQWNPNVRRTSHYGYAKSGPTFVMGNRKTETQIKEFRLELFLTREPWRLQFRANEGSLFRWNDDLLRFRQRDNFYGLLRQIARFLPPNRHSLAMRAALEGRRLVYPNPLSLEEEVIWHLLQRRRVHENREL